MQSEACSNILWLTWKEPQHRRIQDGTIQYRATAQYSISMPPQYSIIQHHAVQYGRQAEPSIKSMEPTSQHRHIVCTTHYSKALHSAGFFLQK